MTAFVFMLVAVLSAAVLFFCITPQKECSVCQTRLDQSPYARRVVKRYYPSGLHEPNRIWEEVVCTECYGHYCEGRDVQKNKDETLDIYVRHRTPSSDLENDRIEAKR